MYSSTFGSRVQRAYTECGGKVKVIYSTIQIYLPKALGSDICFLFQLTFAVVGIEWWEPNFESISQTSRCGFGQDIISSGWIAIFAFCSQWRSASNEAAYETGEMIIHLSFVSFFPTQIRLF